MEADREDRIREEIEVLRTRILCGLFSNCDNRLSQLIYVPPIIKTNNTIPKINSIPETPKCPEFDIFNHRLARKLNKKLLKKWFRLLK